MTLEDLGNLGEFVAAIGVIGSFIYLAYQIRQNTKSVNAASYRDTNSAFRQLLLLPITHPEVIKLYIKASNDFQSVTKEEWIQLNGIYMAQFGEMETLFRGFGEGTVDPELWNSARDSLKRSLGEEALEYWWINSSPTYSKQFTTEVNEIRSEIGST